MTKTKAIEHARQNIGSLYRVGNVYRFHRYSKNGTVRESTPKEYYAAQADRSQALLDSALKFLKLPPVQYQGGVWSDYI